MKIPIILILVALWAAFFLWPLVQRRLGGSRRDSISAFTKKVAVVGKVGNHIPIRSRSAARSPFSAPTPMGRAAGGPVGFTATGTAAGLPMSADAQKRRRDALAVFGLAVLASLLLAVVVGNVVVWTIQIATDLLLVGYLGLLIHLRRRAQEHRAKVLFLPEPTRQSPALVLHRSSVSS